jgi:hypothetical protein
MNKCSVIGATCALVLLMASAAFAQNQNGQGQNGNGNGHGNGGHNPAPAPLFAAGLPAFALIGGGLGIRRIWLKSRRTS